MKAWRLKADGSYERVEPKPARPCSAASSVFSSRTDRVKVADAAGRPSTRFHMTPTAKLSPLEGKVPKATRRRRKDEG